MKMLLVLSVIVSICHVRGSAVNVSINAKAPIHIVNPLSPSFAVGTGIFLYNWTPYLNNAKLLTLVKALGPSYIRMGGTRSDHATFNPNGTESVLTVSQRDCEGTIPNREEFERHQMSANIAAEKDAENKHQHGVFQNVTYTAVQFDEFFNFVKCANFDLVFGLNLLQRKGEDWDPTNSQELLQYAKNKRYLIDWELGNEPNSYFHKAGIRLSPAKIGKDYFQLYNILQRDSWWNRSRLIGPDSNSMYKSKSRKFLKKFLHVAKSTLSATTFHQYYMDSRVATVANFTDYKLLNKLRPQVKDVLKAVRQESPNLPVWIGETSSTFGGGAEGLSDRYIAGFMWLDKLGVCALNGIDAVFRQTLIFGNYAMIDDNFDPNPDYWLTLLYKRLVGPEVLNVSLGHGTHEYGRVRVYAHCTNNARSDYSSGSVTLYYLNLSSRTKSMDLMPYGGILIKRVVAYILTPSLNQLKSSFVNLNGERLKMIDDRTLPDLSGREIRLDEGEKIKLPKLSFGFIILPDVQATACQAK